MLIEEKKKRLWRICNYYIDLRFPDMHNLKSDENRNVINNIVTMTFNNKIMLSTTVEGTTSITR